MGYSPQGHKESDMTEPFHFTSLLHLNKSLKKSLFCFVFNSVSSKTHGSVLEYQHM